MTNRDAATELPGGAAALAAQAEPVYKADLGAIEDLKGKLTTAAEDYGSTVESKVKSSVQELDAAWEGSSADQFVGYMGKFTTAGTQVQHALTSTASDLDTASTALGQAKEKMEHGFSRIVEGARTFLQQNPQAEPGQYAAAVSSLVSAERGGITSAINDANTALGTAAKSIKAHENEITEGFDKLPAANSQVFTPGPGHRVNWKPTPQHAGTTTPAGDDTPTGNGNAPGIGNGNGSGGGSGSGNGVSNFSGGGGGGGGFAGGGGGGGGLGSSGAAPTQMPPGNVQEWIQEAIKELQAHGVNVSDKDIPTIWSIIQHESGGNPHAINNWDSNAAKGTPSKGLMQCIDPTFNSYKLPGHNDIWNPVDNICAGVNYAISRYGSLSNVPGIAAIAHGGGYQGY